MKDRDKICAGRANKIPAMRSTNIPVGYDPLPNARKILAVTTAYASSIDFLGTIAWRKPVSVTDIYIGFAFGIIAKEEARRK